MQPIQFEEEAAKIVARDPRYQADAYLFLRDALDHTKSNVGRSHRDKVEHVTGQQLLEGLRDYALNQFGPMAMTVLAEWGVRSCADFGEIVFNLIDQGLLKKTDKDSREDFKPGYDFQDAFVKPFLPSARGRQAAAVAGEAPGH